jgi:hypothetical protein
MKTLLTALVLFGVAASAQTSQEKPCPNGGYGPDCIVPGLLQLPSETTTTPKSDKISDGSTSNDLFFMVGSDFDRPGLLPRANYNVGLGHTFSFLTNSPVHYFGDEVTVAYTYENGGPKGFWHGPTSTSTESLGLMKNISIPHTKKVTVYTWPQLGLTSIFTGKPATILDTKVVVDGVPLPPTQNRLYAGFAIGAIIHLPHNTSIWIQESYNKVVTVPWYTTTSIGYTISF